MLVAGTVIVPVAKVGFGTGEGVRTIPSNADPFANKFTNPCGAPIVDWLAVTVTLKVTAPELSTVAGVRVSAVVVARLVPVTNAYCCEDEMEPAFQLVSPA
jgi:hypothetical protein